MREPGSKQKARPNAEAKAGVGAATGVTTTWREHQRPEQPAQGGIVAACLAPPPLAHTHSSVACCRVKHNLKSHRPPTRARNSRGLTKRHKHQNLQRLARNRLTAQPLPKPRPLGGSNNTSRRPPLMPNSLKRGTQQPSGPRTPRRSRRGRSNRRRRGGRRRRRGSRRRRRRRRRGSSRRRTRGSGSTSRRGSLLIKS